MKATQFGRRLIAVVLALFFTGSAAADDWKEYENRDYSFTIHFPADPRVETATYQAADGRTFPAHVFSVKQETGAFKVTVVHMPGKQTGSDAAVMKEATKAVHLLLVRRRSNGGTRAGAAR
jgi:hypothetical protein